MGLQVHGAAQFAGRKDILESQVIGVEATVLVDREKPIVAR